MVLDSVDSIAVGHFFEHCYSGDSSTVLKLSSLEYGKAAVYPRHFSVSPQVTFYEMRFLARLGHIKSLRLT